MEIKYEEPNKRLVWKKDKQYMKFNDKITDRKILFTFEEILKFTTLDNYINWDYEEYKQKWQTEINKWNERDNLDVKDKTLGFAAICYLFTTMPREQLDTIKRYFKNENKRLCVVNELYYYQNNEDYGFDNIEYNVMEGPFFSAAFREWWDNKYNSNTFNLGYFVYEVSNNLPFLKIR